MRWQSCLLLIIGVMLMAGPAVAAEYYVATTGSDTDNGLSGGTAWATLAKAVTTASSGDTVHVAAGTYNETVTVGVSNLALVGAGYATTIIDAGDSMGASFVISCDSNALWLQGFTVRNALTGLDIGAGDNQVIIENRFTSCGDYGLDLFGSNNATVSNNQFVNNGVKGAYVSGGGSHLIIGNMFSGNSDQLGGGLYLAGHSGSHIRGNQFTGNSFGINVDNTSNNNIVGQNTFTGNDTALYIVPPISEFNRYTHNNFIGNTINAISWDVYAGYVTDCYFGSSDSSAIAPKMITQSAGLTWEPFRFTWCDTSLDADTVAPAQPYITRFYNGDGQIYLAWNKPDTDAYGNAMADLAGYRLYRWTGDVPPDRQPPYAAIADANDTEYLDSGVAPNTWYHYTVTAYDSHAPYANECFYGIVVDTAPSTSPTAVAGPDTVGAANATIDLEASASSDPDGDSLSYVWEQLGGAWLGFTDTYAQTTTAALLPSDGTYVFRVTVTDSWGRSSSDTFQKIVFPAVAPAVYDTSVLINDDTAYTNSRFVGAYLNTDSSAVYMMISTDSSFTSAVWQAYTTVFVGQLPDSDGMVTVYAKFANGGYYASGVVTDTIILDRVGPETPSVIFLAGDTTSSPSVTLQFSVGEDTTGFMVRFAEYGSLVNSYWTDVIAETTYTLSVGSDTKTVFAQFMDAAQNTSSDSAQIYLEGAPYPAPNFRAQALDGRSVRLQWQHSPSSDRSMYTLYWDDNGGTIDYNWPIAQLDATTTNAYETGPLGTLPDTYAFGIRVTDNEANQELNTNIVAYVTTKVSTGAVSFVQPVIPIVAGKVISGDRFVLTCTLADATDPDFNVWFQYRPAGTLLYSNITPATTWTPNPDNYEPYFIVWDTTQVADGDYDVQVIAQKGVRIGRTTVRITIANGNADINTGLLDGTIIGSSQRVFSGLVTDILAADSNGIYTVSFDSVALNVNTSIQMTIGDTASFLNSISRRDYETAGIVLDVSLDNYQTTFGGTVTIRIPFTDSNGDSIIDGTRVRINLVRIIYYDGTSWNVVPAENTTIDYNNGQIVCYVSHFSKFAPSKENTDGDLGAGDGDNVGDGDVDSDDLKKMNVAYGAGSSDGNYNEDADIVTTGSSEGRIDEEDIFEMADDYGSSQ